MDKLIFQRKNKKELFKFLKNNKERKILNFLNLHDLYHYNREPLFRTSLKRKEIMNFIDGFTISAYLALTNLKNISRLRGPTFTAEFLANENLSKNKRHFFIQLEKEDLNDLRKKFPHLKHIYSYNPSYIKGIQFTKDEIDKIAKKINAKKVDYVWVGIACPKQNILTNSLFDKTNARYFINIGAALDFVLEKKEEAPKYIQKMGIEWLYRLINDFEYSKKKVIRSFIGLKYVIGGVRLE